MIAAFLIHLVITHKGEVSPPLQRFPVVCFAIFDTINALLYHPLVLTLYCMTSFKNVFVFMSMIVQLKTYSFTCLVRVPFT